MPGPSQCHPSTGKTTPSHGCVPMDVLQRVGAQIGVAPHMKGARLRKEIERQRNLCSSLMTDSRIRSAKLEEDIKQLR